MESERVSQNKVCDGRTFSQENPAEHMDKYRISLIEVIHKELGRKESGAKVMNDAVKSQSKQWKQ